MTNIKIIKIIVIVFLIFLAACNDDNGNGCLTPEEIANSECSAEDILLLCEPFFCGASFPPDDENEGIVVDFFFPPESDCEIMDCGTLDCGSAGLFSDLQVDDFGTPSGDITNTLGQQTSFSCQSF